ncbi:uncharacterized protein LAESUDRAFT_812852 [Laetiporus sulphureus 93-53]|uniref:Carbohydrate-binding module family 19 domain-containing protein n=1 Tax=Laetiporus sulphureus 93-53 TaxID=1314785 RepID=A0A165E4X4_9APHY|nr:uncharacterized protein LAESUDRAFT_812852 [Laetiporus sulphureus 93-53]KZT06246.1 hypothetical protein LAESUDRAFT_812852 [Laetiporus sulphureus 93-53]
MKFSAIAVASVLFTSVAHALPWYVPRDSSFLLANGEEAIAQNAQFATLTVNSSCTSGTDACVNSEFAQCVNGAYLLTSCGSGLICAALPLVNSAGTSITCTTEADLEGRIAATGATSASNSTSSSIAASSSVAVTTVSATASATASAAAASSTSESSDAQSSLTLLDSLVNTGFNDDGTNEFSPEAGEIASATSTNNFINFCATVSVPLTNGTQVKNGSCNAAPMGMIASTSNMPSAKFVSPANLDTIAANSTFNVTLAIERLQTGHFVNPDTNFFAAPQTVNTTTGDILGHSHVVIEQLTALNQTTPTDPGTFAFFKGLNSVAVNGQLTVEVTGGLPAGVYRMASINAAANHQPVLVAVAQHGSLDDMVYFTVQ